MKPQKAKRRSEISMDAKKIIKGRRILIVDDEKDILETLIEILAECKIDSASSYEEAKGMLEKNTYDLVVLDIMGVDGYGLLKISRERNIPALMLTANAMTPEDLKRSAEEGASYFAPKEKMENIETYLADIVDSIEKKQSPWKRMFNRLEGYYTKRFNGTDWRDKENKFWDDKVRYRIS